MGYSSDVTNKIDGKKYLISTVKQRSGRAGWWETAVMKRSLFGIPNMFRPILRVIAREERQAQHVHGRVVEIVTQRAQAEWESAKWTLMNDDPEPAPAPAPSDIVEGKSTTGDIAHVLEYFRGKPNTKAVLEEKAKVVTILITSNCDYGSALASALKDNNPAIRLGEGQEREAFAETAVVLLSVLDRTAFQFMGMERDPFMDALEAGVARALQDKGMAQDTLGELLSRRYEEYAHYLKWLPDEGESASGTLFWEFSKKIATTLNVGPDPVFNLNLTNGLLQAILSWKLNELLPE